MKKWMSIWWLISLVSLAWGVPPKPLHPAEWQQFTLPSGTVSDCFFLDHQQYIWVGGQGQVSRFDGHEWETWPLSPALPQESISTFAEAPDGQIWLGTEAGNIYRFVQHQFQLFQPEEGLPKVPIREIAFDADGLCWIATYGEGLYYHNGDRLYNINTWDGLPSNDIYDLSVDTQQRAWVATDQGIGICHLQNGKKQVESITIKDGLPDEIITALTHDPAGQVWIGTYDQGLFRRSDRGQWQEQPRTRQYSITQLVTWKDQIWFLDQEGQISSLREGRLDTTFSLPASRLGVDPKGHIWVLGKAPVLYQSVAYARFLDLKEQVSQALAADSSGGLWIGTQTGLLFCPPGEMTFSPVPGTKRLNLTSLFSDHWGQLWLGTLGQGIWRYSPKSTTLKRIFLPGLGDRVPILSITGKGNQLWLGTFAGAFACGLSPEGEVATSQHLRDAGDTGINYIYQISLDARGQAWLSTDGSGLAHGNAEGLSILPSSDQATIYAHCFDGQGQLYYLDSEGRVLTQSKQGPDTLSAVYPAPALGLSSLDGHRLLLIYEDGLYHLHPTDRQFAPLLPQIDFPSYGQQLNVWTRQGDSVLWIGTPSGLLRIRTDQMPSNLEPTLFLKELKVRLRPTEAGRREFHADENHLTFSYAALWWDAPDRLTYRHRLLGHDLSWVESRDQRAIYPSLAPGDYTFEVQVAVDRRFEQAHTLAIPLTIRKPFWQTLWFIGVTGLGIFLLATLLVKQREKQLKHKEEQQRIIAENQFETLRSQINPHFLFNAFSTLTDIVDESKPKAIAYINRLSDLFRDMLAYRDQPTIPLDDELRVLDNYYQLQKERYGDTFTLEVNLLIRNSSHRIPPLTLQILVENALKHNKVSRSFPLTVTIEREGDFLVIRNPLQPRTTASASTRVGLENVRRRYQFLTDQAPQITINETTFEVRLPLLS